MIKKLRCHFENGSVSSLATSSADFASLICIHSSPNGSASHAGPSLCHFKPSVPIETI
jgi:hypothetical protein